MPGSDCQRLSAKTIKRTQVSRVISVVVTAVSILLFHIGRLPSFGLSETPGLPMDLYEDNILLAGLYT